MHLEPLSTYIYIYIYTVPFFCDNDFPVYICVYKRLSTYPYAYLSRSIRPGPPWTRCRRWVRNPDLLGTPETSQQCFQREILPDLGPPEAKRASLWAEGYATPHAFVRAWGVRGGVGGVLLSFCALVGVSRPRLRNTEPSFGATLSPNIEARLTCTCSATLLALRSAPEVPIWMVFLYLLV